MMLSLNSLKSIPRVQWAVQSIRLGLYLILLAMSLAGLVASNQFRSPDLNSIGQDIAWLGLLISILGFLIPYRHWKRNLTASLFFAADFLFLAYLIRQGTLTVTLLFLFCLLLVAAGGLGFGKWGGALIALTASIYTSAAILLGPDLKSVHIFTQLILSHFGFFVVALVSGYFSDELRSQDKKLGSLKAINEFILDSIPSGVLLANEKGEILQRNSSLEQIFLGFQKLPKVKVGAFNVHDLFPSLRELRRLEEMIVLKVGEEYKSFRVQVVPRTVDEEKTFIVVVEDRTEIQRLEFSQKQAEKLAAVGQLAAGIAHEIRNPLTGISGSIELLSQNSQSADDRKLSKIILKEIDRLNRLITEFLDFAKPEQPPSDLVDLGKLLNEAIEHLKLDKTLNEGGTRWSYKNEGSVMVFAHRDKLKQAFLNILVNALQANQGRPDPAVEIRVYVRDDRAEVSIKDHGSGMKKEILHRIFEPFLTTKARGTGLGLAITHKIIEAHQGRIFVESEEQVGTQFLITFPQVKNEMQKMV